MSKKFFSEFNMIIEHLDFKELEKMIHILSTVKKKGRLFIFGSGGGAGHASHAVCDFRKLCLIEAYCLSDNISELTAQINDSSWEESYLNMLKNSKFNKNDCLFIFSVGGGDLKKKVSVNLINCVKYAMQKKAKIISVTGRQNSYIANKSNANISISKKLKINYLTAQTESLQALIWHYLVSHSKLQTKRTVW